MSKQLKVLLLGIIPPPVGGISIHIKRFIDIFYNKDGINCILLDYKKNEFYKNSVTKITFLEGLKFIIQSDIIHLHISTNIKLIIAFIAKFIFFKKVIYTHHNSVIKAPRLHSILFSICDKIILVNSEKIDQELINKFKKKIVEIPAFIPPASIDDLPDEWLQKIPKDHKIISSNAYAFSKINGKDVYGIDILLEASIHLETQTDERFCLIIVDPQNQYSQIIEPYLKQIKIIHINELIDFNSIIKLSNIIVRSTRTDGDSITIREALYYNTAIIASDCVTRPEGTILFENENVHDLGTKIRNELFNYSFIVKESNSDFSEPVIKVYKEISNSK